MSAIDDVSEIVHNFVFRKGDYLGAKKQLLNFADHYAKLKVNEAEVLRNYFDPKDRLGLLQVASSLFKKDFSDAHILQKDELLRIFFALYSFDNLEFGFDSIRVLISISDQIKSHIDLAKKNWDQFSKITSNEEARKNLENKIFT